VPSLQAVTKLAVLLIPVPNAVELLAVGIPEYPKVEKKLLY
jgi:hypothetical protein